MDTIRIFVGTDPFMSKAEKALVNSLKATTSGPYEIIWMDYSRGGIWSNWNIGRPRRQPYSGTGWGTDFSCFRFAIPEAAGFEGRAIYLDVDMILLKDIREMFELPMDKAVLSPGKWDVLLYDCAKFKEFDWWPKLDEMRPSGYLISHYKRLLEGHNQIDKDMPVKWDCCDGIGYNPDETALVHYTNMNTQPWKPYPDVFEYPEHPCPEVVKLFWDYHDAG